MNQIGVEIIEPTHQPPKLVGMRQRHNPSTGTYGDCLRAAIATLLGMPYEHVIDVGAHETPEWLAELNRWLRDYGIALVMLDAGAPGSGHKNIFEQIDAKDCWMMVQIDAVKFPGQTHATVGKDGLVLYDPSPEPSGVHRPIAYGVFIVLEPWKFIKLWQNRHHIGDSGEQAKD